MKELKVNKVLTKEELRELEGKHLKVGYFKNVLREDVDVFDEEGRCILRFRKNVLKRENLERAYDAVIKHARKYVSTRGMAGGGLNKKKDISTNTKIQSNILGYFEKFSPIQKAYFREAKVRMPNCRATAFTMNYPLKWKEVIPLIQDIDEQYRILMPDCHRLQKEACQSTKFQIADTAFSTITTNLNLQTACHTDKGDFKKGYGNLIVIEKGDGYEGGFTGFPEYGIAVDVRKGDFLLMDVHRLHGNEPIIKKSLNSERLSFVSYLREGILAKCVDEEIYDEKYFRNIRSLAKENNFFL